MGGNEHTGPGGDEEAFFLVFFRVIHYRKNPTQPSKVLERLSALCVFSKGGTTFLLSTTHSDFTRQLFPSIKPA